MNSSTGFLIADVLDIVAYSCFLQVSTTEVLNWVYTIVLIASVVFGIVRKIISALQDGKITKEEQQEIEEEVNKLKEITDEANKKENEEKEDSDNGDVHN